MCLLISEIILFNLNSIFSIQQIAQFSDFKKKKLNERIYDYYIYRNDETVVLMFIISVVTFDVNYITYESNILHFNVI